MNTLIWVFDKAGDLCIRVIVILGCVSGAGAIFALPVIVFGFPGVPLTLKIILPVMYAIAGLVGFRLYRMEYHEG